MLLKDYFPNLQKKYHKLSFKGIAFNSNEVKQGYIFFAFKGNNTDGNFFINDAIKNGSKIIITDKFKINGWKNNILFLNNKNPRITNAESWIARSLIDTVSPAIILVIIINKPKAADPKSAIQTALLKPR